MSQSDPGSQAGEPEAPKNVLKLQNITASLSMIDKTVDGSSYAFVKLVIEEKEIEQLGDQLESYIHLRFVSLAKNSLKDIYCVSKLPHLLTLNASENQIQNTIFMGQVGALLFLQQVNLSQNKITALKPLRAPRVRTLNLNDNQIATAQDFLGHDMLQILELRNNKLTTPVGLKNMPNLTELYLEGNQLTSIKGLEDLPKLQKLDVKGNQVGQALNILDNQIVAFDEVPDLPLLHDLDLGGNQIEGLKELEKLSGLKTIKILNVGGNESLDGLGDGIKKELLILLEDFKFFKVNDEEVSSMHVIVYQQILVTYKQVTQDDVNQAKQEKIERIKKQEEERLEAERLKAEAQNEGKEQQDDDD